MRLAYRVALILAATCAVPAASAAAVTDAASCDTLDGWNAFIAQWNIDLMGALTAGALKPEVYDYISARAKALASAMPAKPTPGDMVQHCEYLNALYAR
jgi:hypothetical protein